MRRPGALTAALGRLVRQPMRVPDLVARWGGEEFVIALVSTDAAGGAVAAERVRQSIEALEILDKDGSRIPVTISVGLATLGPAEDVDRLIDRADRAMYAAKAAGRNRVAVSADALEVAAGGAAPRAWTPDARAMPRLHYFLSPPPTRPRRSHWMKAYTGISTSEDGEVAVREATASVPPGVRPDVVFAFTSTRQDPDAVARALAARFPGSLITGCTTAGEIVDDRHANGSVVVAALESPEVRWSLQPVRGLRTFDEASARETAEALFSALGIKADDADPAEALLPRLH